MASINYHYDGFSYAFGLYSAIDYLPTVNQWSNMSLLSTERTLVTDLGNSYSSEGDLPTDFSYTRYEDDKLVPLAARILTFQELSNACPVETIFNASSNNNFLPYLENCNYLFENTNYADESSSLSGFS